MSQKNFYITSNSHVKFALITRAIGLHEDEQW